jgi:FkbM family methyltransferase
MGDVIAGHERFALDRIRDCWPFAFSPLAVDVGANVGDWTAELLARFPRAIVLAFEPQAHAHAQLHERFSGKGMVAPVRMGLSDAPREATLTASSHGACVLATLHERDDAENYHGSGVVLDRAETVWLDTLDAFVPPRVHVLKIDVEGHELAVLRGGRETLAGTDIVQFEFNDCAGQAGVTFRDLHDFLTPRFRLYLERDDSLQRVDDVELHEWQDHDGDARDYLAVARDCDWFTP